MRNLDGTSSSFDASDSDYLHVYFTTDITALESAGEYSYDIRLVDDFGLYSSAVVSNKADQLKEPVFSVSQNGSYEATEETGLYPLVISHTRETKNNGNPCKEMPSVVYTVRNSSNAIVASGTKVAPVTVPLPVGKDYKIEAYSVLNGFVDSDSVSVSSFTVTRCRDYYVSKTNGDDTDGTGSRLKPFKTISKCAGEIKKQIDDFSDKGKYNIYLLSDIESEKDADISVAINPTAKFDELNIIGYENQRTIDASKSKGLSVDVKADQINIKNIVVEKASNYGLQLNNASNGGASVNIENSKFINNKGIGVMNYYTGALTLNNVTITGNISSANGYGNVGGMNYNGAQLNLKGKIIITDNHYVLNNNDTLCNLYVGTVSDTQKLITITGSLSGSKIGITTQTVPEIGNDIQFTSGFASNNSGLLPLDIFTSDTSNSFKLSNGEVYVAAGGISVDPPSSLDSKLTISAINSTTFVIGTQRVLTLKAVVKDSNSQDVDITSSVDWNFKFYMNQENLTSYISKGTTEATKNKVSFSTSIILPGNYYLYVFATYKGVTYTTMIPVSFTKQ